MELVKGIEPSRPPYQGGLPPRDTSRTLIRYVSALVHPCYWGCSMMPDEVNHRMLRAISIAVIIVLALLRRC
jgi:hypothetical protein